MRGGERRSGRGRWCACEGRWRVRGGGGAGMWIVVGALGKLLGICVCGEIFIENV